MARTRDRFLHLTLGHSKLEAKSPSNYLTWQLVKVLVASVAVSSTIILAPSALANTLTYASGQCQASITSPGTISSNSVEINMVRVSSKDYCVVTFKDVASYQANLSGSTAIESIEYLIVGGGGGGNSGGGGGGGVLQGSLPNNGALSISVGDGGSGGFGGAGTVVAVGTNGNNSTLSDGSVTKTAFGGGAGGYKNSTIYYGQNGGSGGGAGYDSGNAAGSGTAGQGNNGGATCPGGYCAGGGGGGAGAVGEIGYFTANAGIGGNGGAGAESLITGTSQYFGGGGGGGLNSNTNLWFGTSTTNRTESSNLSSDKYVYIYGGGAGGIGGGGRGSSYGYTNGTRGANANATSGTTNTGGGGGGTDPEDIGAGAGGSGVVIVRYETDATSPNLSGTSFAVNENIAAPYTAATITLSETSTISSLGGDDFDRFNILLPDSLTVVINFKDSPDYESPTDNGANNAYEISFVATDSVGNSTAGQLISIMVMDVLDIASFNSLNLAGSVTTANYRTAIDITASVSLSSKISFTVNGKVIPGCKKRITAGSGATYLATCRWKPALHGLLTLLAVADPIANGVQNITATPIKVFVNRRTGARAFPSPT